MATKKKESVALAPGPQKSLSWYEQGETVLGLLAKELSTEVTAPRMAEIVRQLTTWEEDIAALAKAGKQRLLELVEDKGEVVTEKGTKVYEADGWHLEARPWRTGFDSKKVETMLRAKGLEPDTHMNIKVSYEVDEVKLKLLQLNGRVTEAEMDLAKYDRKMVLLTPKKLKGKEADDE